MKQDEEMLKSYQLGDKKYEDLGPAPAQDYSYLENEFSPDSSDSEEDYYPTY